MNSSSQRHQKRNRSRDPLERRMDQWIETGRQFVDGVAGNRPGQRKSSKAIGTSLDGVGRWVGDKIDWFFEEEDDWAEPWQLEKQDLKMNLPNQKRPLQAISLRGTKAIRPASQADNIEDEWPDEATFKVNKWERQDLGDSIQQVSKDRPDSQIKTSRRLPRSSRRRF